MLLSLFCNFTALTIVVVTIMAASQGKKLFMKFLRFPKTYLFSKLRKKKGKAVKIFKMVFPSQSKSPLLSIDDKASVIRQKGESQNGCYKKTKHAKFSEKRTFLTP